MDEKLDESSSVNYELTSTESPTKRYCLNCNTELTDVFCSHCGQRDFPKRQTLTEILTNFISSFWSFESKFFKTGQYLLLRPGFLAVEYTEGRRERYFHPARMYVFISFIYFLLFYSLPEANDHELVQGSNENVTIKGYGITLSIDSLEVSSMAEYDSIQQTLPADERDGWFERLLRKRGIEVTRKVRENKEGFARDLTSTFTSNFPKIFFILLPVFALVLKLLHLRRDFFYSEHLVFSIYYYNFFFLAGSFYMLLNLSSWSGWLAILTGIWIAVYLLLGMKRMYRQKWSTTALKYLGFMLIFSTFVMIGLLLNLMVTLIYI
jgi:Protein of unknown function (DUF3667)